MKKALFVALWVCIGLTAMAQITLSFSPTKGSTYEYQTEVLQKIKQDVMGQSMSINNKMVMTYDMTVLENSASEVKIEMIYNAILFDMSSAMMNMKYDSKNPATSSGPMDEMMNKIFGSMLNKKFHIILEHDGSVKSVTGMKAIVDDMMAALGNDAMAAQMGQQMSGQFTDEAMKATFEQGFKIYPGKTLKPGDSWNIEQSTGTAGVDMLIKSVYTLKSADKKTAYTDIVSTISGLDGQLTGEQSGTIEFDLKLGLPVKSNVNQKISGTVSAQGMEIPMEISSEAINTIKKKN